MLFYNKALWFFLWTHTNQQTVKKSSAEQVRLNVAQRKFSSVDFLHTIS